MSFEGFVSLIRYFLRDSIFCLRILFIVGWCKIVFSRVNISIEVKILVGSFVVVVIVVVIEKLVSNIYMKE